MPICDGCGGEADAQHIRRRIERLELATRFRPVHIQVLLIDGAPPVGMSDYFYRAYSDVSDRSPSSAQYRAQILECAGLAPNPGGTDESLLADFQRRGFYLAYAAECPIESDQLSGAIQSSSGSLMKRVQYSYRPKTIALLSTDTRPLIRVFEQGGWGHCLVLDNGEPFAGSNFSGRLREALSGVI